MYDTQIYSKNTSLKQKEDTFVYGWLCFNKNILKAEKTSLFGDN